MKALLLTSLLLFASCAPTVQLVDPPAMVVPNEYVIHASGPWQPWAKGLRSSQVYPEGNYVIRQEGQEIRIMGTDSILFIQGSTVPPTYVPYDESKDLCKEITQQGVSCSPNFVMKAYERPNDPFYDRQWGYKRMQSEKAWDTVNHTDVKVAVIDTGVSPHPDLNQSIKGGYNAISNNSGNYNDDNGHGSHVSGTACGYSNNSLGVSGATWSCNLFGVKFLSANGSGSLFDAIKAIDWSIANGVRIISASWGGGGYSQPLYDAIKRARDANILFIAAAGNEGRNTDTVANYPSGYELDNVISVGSIDQDGRLSYFSNFGNQSVDLVAPGGSILSTNNLGGYVTLSGTSMATPMVSGVAALIWQQDPSLTYLQVKERLFANAVKRPDLKVRIGELNADAFTLPPTQPVLCDKIKRDRCYAGCKRQYPNQPNKKRKCRRACRIQHHCEVTALEWISEQLGID